MPTIYCCVFCNSGHIDLAYDDVRYTVYSWGFSCLDYSFDVLSHKAINWVCATDVVAVLAFIGFYIRFLVYDHYYIITAYILLYHLCSISQVSCSYLIIPWVFSAWYRLLSLYLLMYAYAHDTIFNACLWFEFIDTRVLFYACHLSFASWLIGEFDFPGSSCSGLGAWSLWILWMLIRDASWSVDRRQTIWSPILSGPLRVSRVFLL